MNIKFPKTLIWITILLILIALLLIPKIFHSNTEINKASKSQRKSVVVDYVILEPEKFDDVIISNGTILPDEEVELRSEISGKLEKIYFKEGRFVKKGALLFKINDDELQAQMLKLKTRMQLAEIKEKRQKALLEKQGISQEEYDIALNELLLIKADINELETKIQKTFIQSPFDGIIGLRWVSEGAFVTPSTKLANIQKNNPIKIEFSIPQEYSQFIRINSTVIFSTPGLAAELYAKVYAYEPRMNDNTRTILVRAISNNQHKLLPGSYVKVKYILNQNNNAILIPSDIIVPDAQGETVFIYKDGKAIQRLIRTRTKTDSLVEVIEGLIFGDTLISSAIIQLRNEMPVSLR